MNIIKNTALKAEVIEDRQSSLLPILEWNCFRQF